MQTPSNPAGSPLDLTGSLNDGEDTASPGPGESLQRILRFELKEEGNHVLAVTVTYTETALGEGKAASGRVRTFRKLYQFVAQQLLSVRTKAGELTQQNGLSKYLLEAQLENMGEAAVCLEVRDVLPCPWTPNCVYPHPCRLSYISSICNRDYALPPFPWCIVSTSYIANLVHAIFLRLVCGCFPNNHKARTFG
jgi:hypothetical protein